MPLGKLFQSIRQWILSSVSIRLRLALWYGTLLFVTLTLFSIIVFAVAQFQLDNSVDQGLQGNAQLIAQTIQNELLAARDTTAVTPTTTATATATSTPLPQTATPSPLATGEATTSQPTPVPTVDPAQEAKFQHQIQLSSSARDLLNRLDLTFEVVNANATIVYKAPNIQSSGLPIDISVLQAALDSGACNAYDATQNPSHLRIYVYPVTFPLATTNHSSATPSSTGTANAGCMGTTRDQVVGAVLVAKTVDDVTGSLDTLRRLLVIGVIIAFICTTIGGWFIAGSSLQPISKVTRIARAIAVNAHAAGLGRRVGYIGPRDEVGELAGTFDDMLEAIERVATAQRRFIADASHELRAPLTSIKGNLEFLRMARKADEQARTEAIDDAYAEAERMTALVNDLLLLARADATAGSTPGSRAARLDDQMRGRREMLELDQLALTIFHTARMQVENGRKAKLHIGIGHLEPVAVMADPGQMRQVMMILLDNALKYTPEKGRVTVSVTREDGRAAISISDTGMGIEPEVMPHIFERFYRGDTARDRDEHGSGLGLAIADWIVQAHNGELRVTSTPGKGSTFSVLLPALKRSDEQSSVRLPAVRRQRPGRSVVAGAIAPLTRLANSVSNVSRPRTENQRKAADTSAKNDNDYASTAQSNQSATTDTEHTSESPRQRDSRRLRRRPQQ